MPDMYVYCLRLQYQLALAVLVCRLILHFSDLQLKQVNFEMPSLNDLQKINTCTICYVHTSGSVS